MKRMLSKCYVAAYNCYVFAHVMGYSMIISLETELTVTQRLITGISETLAPPCVRKKSPHFFLNTVMPWKNSLSPDLSLGSDAALN